jgi:hypothetical protein
MLSEFIPHMSAQRIRKKGLGTSIGLCSDWRLMPLGRPVVPDEYSMS